MNDPLDLIEQGCYLCLRFMLKPSTIPTGCLQVAEDDYYFLSHDAKVYHPLEAVLIGEPKRSDDWKADAASKLSVSAEWVVGFLDGFAQSGEISTDQDYLQGYLTAEELRTRRFRKFLP